jgi:hypothetical protein
MTRNANGPVTVARGAGDRKAAKSQRMSDFGVKRTLTRDTIGIGFLSGYAPRADTNQQIPKEGDWLQSSNLPLRERSMAQGETSMRKHKLLIAVIMFGLTWAGMVMHKEREFRSHARPGNHPLISGYGQRRDTPD